MRKGKRLAGSQVTYPQQESISRRNILRESIVIMYMR